jgi:hypothetical protein
MQMSGQFHALATLPPRKESYVPVGQETMWVLQPVWKEEEVFPETLPQYHFLGQQSNTDSLGNEAKWNACYIVKQHMDIKFAR